MYVRYRIVRHKKYPVGFYYTVARKSFIRWRSLERDMFGCPEEYETVSKALTVLDQYREYRRTVDKKTVFHLEDHDNVCFEFPSRETLLGDIVKASAVKRQKRN